MLCLGEVKGFLWHILNNSKLHWCVKAMFVTSQRMSKTVQCTLDFCDNVFHLIAPSQIFVRVGAGSRSLFSDVITILMQVSKKPLFLIEGL